MSYEFGRSARDEIKFGMQQSKIVAAIASWCDALRGATSLETALGDLCDGLGAEAGMLVRTRRPHGQDQRIAIYDPQAERSCGRPLRLSLSSSAFGEVFDSAKAGSIWVESDIEGKLDPFLKSFQAARGFRDFCVLVLSSTPFERDHIELHFRTAHSEPVLSTLGAVMPTMAKTWAARQFGVVSKEIAKRRSGTPGSIEQDEPLLSAKNPAKLSRSEYRLCLLMSRGLSASGAAAELGVSDATVRSHLRSIYAKTGTGSQSELLFRLIGPRPRVTHSNLRYA